MNQVVLHPTPRAGVIVREQFRAVGVGLRREILAAIAVIIAITVLVLVAVFRGSTNESVTLSPDGAGFVLGLIGLLTPLAVWKSETPSNRGYFWSLPVPRGRHALIKVFSGWAWLMIGISTLLGWIALQVFFTGGTPGVDEMRYVFADAATPAIMHATVDPAALRQVHWTTPSWQWVVPFIAPTIAYLIGSAATLISDHPWRLLAAPLIVFGLLGALAEAGNFNWLANFSYQILAGPYSTETLFTGSNEAATYVNLTTGKSVHVWRNLAQAQQWFTTALIWFVPAFTAMAFAARRYQER